MSTFRTVWENPDYTGVTGRSATLEPAPTPYHPDRPLPS